MDSTTEMPGQSFPVKSTSGYDTESTRVITTSSIITCSCDGGVSSASITLFVVGTLFLVLGLGLILWPVLRRKCRIERLTKADDVKTDSRSPIPAPRSASTFQGDYIDLDSGSKSGDYYEAVDESDNHKHSSAEGQVPTEDYEDCAEIAGSSIPSHPAPPIPRSAQRTPLRDPPKPPE